MNHTTAQYQYFESLYKFYNQRLFANKLPDVLLNFTRKHKVSGMFVSDQWKDHNGKLVHEISINPDAIKEQFDVDFHQTLVHEMVHLWQQEHGKNSRLGYHNKQWAKKMISIGLMPSDTGKEGGKTTGQNMSDYFIEDGQFILAFKRLQEEKFAFLPLKPNNDHLYCQEVAADGSITFAPVIREKNKDSKAGVRVKYTCECPSNVWGKSDLNIRCNVCESDFIINNL